MNNEMQLLYQQRLTDYKNTCNHIQPKRVPVVGYYLSWAVGYAGAKTRDLLNEPDTIADAFRKSYDDIYADLNWGGITTPIPALERLGSDAFFISEDGHTIQHKEHCFMEMEDYPEMIETGKKFLIDVLGKRKFPELQKSRAEGREALIDAMLYINRFNAGNARWNKVLREEYGVVPLVDAGKVYPPMDVLFDRLRGFTGALSDLRRKRESVKAALSVLDELYRPLTYSAGTGDTYAVCTLHCPTYLNFKDFKEIFWPGLRDYCLEVYKRGSKTLLVMEGNWNRYYSLMMDDLPRDSILCCLDGDNVIESNKIINNYFPILGGLNTNVVKYASERECIDEAKRVIDECAPGGGYIFCLDKALCSLSDVNTNNLKAVHQFVHEYGTY